MLFEDFQRCSQGGGLNLKMFSTTFFCIFFMSYRRNWRVSDICLDISDISEIFPNYLGNINLCAFRAHIMFMYTLHYPQSKQRQDSRILPLFTQRINPKCANSVYVCFCWVLNLKIVFICSHFQYLAHNLGVQNDGSLFKSRFLKKNAKNRNIYIFKIPVVSFLLFLDKIC